MQSRLFSRPPIIFNFQQFIIPSGCVTLLMRSATIFNSVKLHYLWDKKKKLLSN